LSDGAIVHLFSEAKATEKERHAQDKQEVGENRAKKRGLYDADFVLYESDDKDNQLDSISKRDVQKGTKRVAKLASHALSGVAEQSSQRDNGDRVHSEDDGRRHAWYLGDDDANWYEYQQRVYKLVVQ